MKAYKISKDKYLVTDGSNVYELNESAVMNINNMISEKNETKNISKIKRFILISEKYYESIQALGELGIKTDYADPEKIEYNIKNDTIHVTDKEFTFTVSKKDVGNTVVFIKSGYSKPELTYLYEEFAKLGILVINSPDGVAKTSNKWVTYELLNQNNINQPKSVLVTSNDISKKEHSELDKKLKQIYSKPEDDDKYVCKLLKGHGGRGVFICRQKNILSILQTIFAINSNEQILVQKFINIKDGDIRVNVLTIGDKQEIINAVNRTKENQSDFRTNLSLGGHAEEITVDNNIISVAKNVAKLSGLVWAGVDIIKDDDNNIYVIEINGAPGTPYDVENKNDLLEKNINFYASLVKMIDKML